MAWSYSSLTLFKQCPRKYYHLRVLRDVVEPETEHLLYGSAVHKAAEEYGRDGLEIPKKFEFIKPMLDTLLAAPGTPLFEHKMAVTRDFEPCDFDAPEAWWRGIADLMILQPKERTALLVDYKTGKSAKYADTDQLKLLALAIFAQFPEIDTVKAGLLFVVSKEFLEIEVRREDADQLWSPFVKHVGMLEQCQENDTWNPSPNFTCRNYCAVKSCEFNGRR